MSYWSFSIEDQVALVSPKEEAAGTLTLDAVSELSDVLETLGALTSTVAVVVISGGGHGRFLSDVHHSQFGISELVNGENVAVKADRSAWGRLAVTLPAIPQPTVAAIDGPASSGGNVVALHCTLRIGSERAAFAPFDLGLGIVGYAQRTAACTPGRSVPRRRAADDPSRRGRRGGAAHRAGE